VHPHHPQRQNLPLQIVIPANKIQQQAQRLDEISNRLQSQTIKNLEHKKLELNAVQSKLQSRSPQKKIKEQRQQLHHIKTRLRQITENTLHLKKSVFAIKMTKLDTISPLKTLDRGYSIVKDKKSDKIITSVFQTEPKQSILIKLKDGELNAKIDH